ncbi:MAG: hypothetical protein WBD40_00215, partial [Tepidisphaeraceae bacterium]
AAPIDLGETTAALAGRLVQVASLIDLVRLAEASPAESDRERVPALRRTLQLTHDQDAADAA